MWLHIYISRTSKHVSYVLTYKHQELLTYPAQTDNNSLKKCLNVLPKHFMLIIFLYAGLNGVIHASFCYLFYMLSSVHLYNVLLNLVLLTIMHFAQ